jgi:hypothetical protein
MNDHDSRLSTTASRVVREAAATLGVDPVALAEWLDDGHRLAHLLLLLGRPNALAERRADLEEMLRQFRAFLQQGQAEHEVKEVRALEWPDKEWL